MSILLNVFPCVFRKMAARRMEEGTMNAVVPPQVDQVEEVLQGSEGYQVPP